MTWRTPMGSHLETNLQYQSFMEGLALSSLQGWPCRTITTPLRPFQPSRSLKRSQDMDKELCEAEQPRRNRTSCRRPGPRETQIQHLQVIVEATYSIPLFVEVIVRSPFLISSLQHPGRSTDRWTDSPSLRTTCAKRQGCNTKVPASHGANTRGKRL